MSNPKAEPLSFSETIRSMSSRLAIPFPSITVMPLPPSDLRCILFVFPDIACGENMRRSLSLLPTLLLQYKDEMDKEKQGFQVLYLYLPSLELMSEAEKDALIAGVKVVQAVGGVSRTALIESPDTMDFPAFLRIAEVTFVEVLDSMHRFRAARELSTMPASDKVH